MNMLHHISKAKHSIMLISLIIIAFSGIVFNQYFEQQIFPSITTPITLSKQEAIHKALVLNKKSAIGLPDTPDLHTAASYITDNATNNYLSLMDKSNTLLNDSIQKKRIHTSYWAVRLFISENIQENFYYFAPDGSQLGYAINIPEDRVLPNLSKEEAIELAKKKLNVFHMRGINPKSYQLKDHSEEKLLQRIDHTLVFENTEQSLKDAKLQIQVVVSGDRITTLRPIVKLPENFSREFNEMMSFNNTLSILGSVVITLGYGGMILFALYQGQKKQNLNWHDGLYMTGIITFFLSINNLNVLPLMWFSAYQTSQSTLLFISNNIMGFIHQAIISFITLSPCLVAGEYLDRKAFPNHVHIWSWWHTESASSKQTSFLVLIAYIIFGINVGYTSIFYLIAQKIPSVWIPTGPLFNPDLISTYIPSIYPFSLSLQAGTLEECLFRAVPIASAILIGIRYQKVSLALAIILPLQAIFFGLAHASYPQQPFYIRTLELFIPFFGYGIIYFNYGLIPCIIAHYLFDVYQFSMIIFNMNTNMIWLQQSICILWMMLPALIVIKAKIANKVFLGNVIPDKFLNKNWQPSTLKVDQNALSTKKKTAILSRTDKISASIICVIATGIIIFSWTHSLRLTPPLQVDKAKSLQIAEHIAQQQFLDLSKDWTVSQTAHLINNDNNAIGFLTEHIGQAQLENLLRNPVIRTDQGNLNLKTFLPHYSWIIRYALFTGTQTERAEELIIHVSDNDTSFQHHLSENKPGETIDEAEALKLALNQLTHDYGTTETFELIKQSSLITPSKRVDWLLTLQFKTPPQLETIKPRVDIKISGNRITGKHNYLFIPEKWQQAQEINQSKVSFIKTIVSIARFSFICILLIFACQYITAHKVNFTMLNYVFWGIFIIGTINTTNNIQTLLSSFSSSINFSNQILFTIAGSIIYITMLSITAGLLTYYTTALQKNYLSNTEKRAPYFMGIGLGLGLSATKLIIANIIAPENNWQFSNIEILSELSPILFSLKLIPNYLINTMLILSALLWSQDRAKPSITYNIITILIITVFSHQLILSHQAIVTTPYLLIMDFIVVYIYIASIWPILKKQPLIIPSMVAMTYACHSIISTKNPAFTGYNFVQIGIAIMVTLTTIAMTTLYQNHQYHKVKRRQASK